MHRSRRRGCPNILCIPAPSPLLASPYEDLLYVYALAPHFVSYSVDIHALSWIGCYTNTATHNGYSQDPSTDTRPESAHSAISSSADQLAPHSISQYTCPRLVSSGPLTSLAISGYLCMLRLIRDFGVWETLMGLGTYQRRYTGSRERFPRY
jgi:hypothetical protein